MLRHLTRCAVAASLALAFTACRVTEIRRPIAATGQLLVGTPAAVWEVFSAEEGFVGMVVRFDGGDDSHTIFMVRNVWHQDLGQIDSLGRAYRYLPHHKDPAWVGSGTVLQGVERILGAADCQLVERSFGSDDDGARAPRTTDSDGI